MAERHGSASRAGPSQPTQRRRRGPPRSSFRAFRLAFAASAGSSAGAVANAASNAVHGPPLGLGRPGHDEQILRARGRHVSEPIFFAIEELLLDGGAFRPPLGLAQHGLGKVPPPREAQEPHGAFAVALDSGCRRPSIRQTYRDRLGRPPSPRALWPCGRFMTRTTSLRPGSSGKDSTSLLSISRVRAAAALASVPPFSATWRTRSTACSRSPASAPPGAPRRGKRKKPGPLEDPLGRRRRGQLPGPPIHRPKLDERCLGRRAGHFGERVEQAGLVAAAPMPGARRGLQSRRRGLVALTRDGNGQVEDAAGLAVPEELPHHSRRRTVRAGRRRVLRRRRDR